jgi:hypothetical protein
VLAKRQALYVSHACQALFDLGALKFKLFSIGFRIILSIFEALFFTSHLQTTILSFSLSFSKLRMAWNSSRPVRQLHLLNKLDIIRWASYAEVTFRAKNSYFIERRPIDYVPTATLWSCCGRVP